MYSCQKRNTFVCPNNVSVKKSGLLFIPSFQLPLNIIWEVYQVQRAKCILVSVNWKGFISGFKMDYRIIGRTEVTDSYLNFPNGLTKQCHKTSHKKTCPTIPCDSYWIQNSTSIMSRKSPRAKLQILSQEGCIYYD